MNVDIYGNNLNVGDEVVVFYEVVLNEDSKLRSGVLRFIDENKRTALVQYKNTNVPLAIDKKCVVLASDPRVTMLVLQM